MLSCRLCTGDSRPMFPNATSHELWCDVPTLAEGEKGILEVTGSFVSSNCVSKWLHVWSEDRCAEHSAVSPNVCIYVFSQEMVAVCGDKRHGCWKEASDLLEHPNGRLMAWKLNQLGSRGQRKWPLGQWTPPPDHRKGHAHNVVAHNVFSRASSTVSITRHISHPLTH